MDVVFPTDPKKLREFNFERYRGIQPSWELIMQVVEKSKLKRLTKFERIWGIPHKSLTLYKIGERDLPIAYWHIFYDFDIVNQMYSKLRQKRKSVTNKVTEPKIHLPNKHYINEFKSRQPAG